MRTAVLLLFATLLLSCTANHYHDGKYQAAVFIDGSMSWVQNEEIELRGSDMYYRSLSLADNSILNELKITCVQYEDHIEFKNKEGITVISRIDEEGNIRYGEYTYKKVGEGEPVLEQTRESAQPLIQNNGDGTITLYDERKKEAPKEEIIPAAHNTFFTGTKKFSDGDGWEYVVEVQKDGEVTLKLYPSVRNDMYKERSQPIKVITGKLQDGFVVTSNANSCTLYFENGKLFEANNKGGWDEYKMVN